MTLPADVARCPGREWEECASCRRREPAADERRQVYMTPPTQRIGWCEYWLPARPADAGAQDDRRE